jgi:hypothetical protein
MTCPSRRTLAWGAVIFLSAASVRQYRRNPHKPSRFVNDDLPL